MTPLTWILVVALALVLFALGLIQVAHRLDRLNLRVLAAAGSLRAARAGRTAAALELAASGTLDPAASLLLADAAHRAREALDHGDIDRILDGDRPDLDERVGRVEQAETHLTQAIRAVAEQAPADGGPPEGFRDLDDAGLMLTMARRLYNDAAAQCTQLHAARAVRWFRLAGRSGPPATLDFDDAVPVLGPVREPPGR